MVRTSMNRRVPPLRFIDTLKTPMGPYPMGPYGIPVRLQVAQQTFALGAGKFDIF